MTTTTPPSTSAPPDGPQRPAGRLTWRRVIFAGLLGTTGAFGLVHAIGGTMTAWIAGGSAAAAGGGYALYKYPHVRAHYWGPWSRRREGKGQKGFSAAWMKNWRQKMPGNPFRGKGSLFGRRGGAGTGRRGLATAFRRAGSGLRRAGSGLRRAGSGLRRAGSGFRRG